MIYFIYKLINMHSAHTLIIIVNMHIFYFTIYHYTALISISKHNNNVMFKKKEASHFSMRRAHIEEA